MLSCKPTNSEVLSLIRMNRFSGVTELVTMTLSTFGGGCIKKLEFRSIEMEFWAIEPI
jgi:hypothetical protein